MPSADVVDAVAKRIHHREGADHGERNGDPWDDGRPESAQEQEYHAHHKPDGEQQGVANAVNRCMNGLCTFTDDIDMNRGRQRLQHVRQGDTQAIDCIDYVLAWFPVEVDDDTAFTFGPGATIGILHSVGYRRHRAKPYRDATARGDNQGAVILGLQELMVVLSDMLREGPRSDPLGASIVASPSAARMSSSPSPSEAAFSG